MHACSIDATRSDSDLTALIVGHACLDVPGVVAEQAARLAEKKVKGRQLICCEQGHYLLLALTDDPWLRTGGEDWRLLGKELLEALRDQGCSSCIVELDAEPEAASALCEGMILGDYRYTACRSGEAAVRPNIRIHLPGHDQAVLAGVALAEAQNQARSLGDGPGNLVHPASVVERAQALFQGKPVKVKVIQGVDDLREAGFPGLVQVGKNGSQPPALLELRYRPDQSKQKRHLALVGKGITFDSGGISLKPGPDMWMMKADMGGAAAVLGAMLHVAYSRPDYPVTAWCALAENMPGQNAQRPGDIYQARNGTWIHVDNTDAEGRLVLADVLTYACEQGATQIVDLATLTGACILALGHSIAAVMSPDEAWAQQIRSAGQTAGEELWPLPLYSEYRQQLEHVHADLNNIGGKPAGTITAGIFLQQFVTDQVQWAHCDIAGTAMQNRAKPWRYYQPGMIGFGVRTLARLVDQLGAEQ